MHCLFSLVFEKGASNDVYTFHNAIKTDIVNVDKNFEKCTDFLMRPNSRSMYIPTDIKMLPLYPMLIRGELFYDIR